MRRHPCANSVAGGLVWGMAVRAGREGALHRFDERSPCPVVPPRLVWTPIHRDRPVRARSGHTNPTTSTSMREGSISMASAVNHTEGTVASHASTTTRMTRRLFGKRLAGAIGAGAIAATVGLGATREQASAARMSGQVIADYAMQFHGYAYVWAGNSPATGFDCSGLTQYVVLNTVGIDIGHGTAGQMNYGRW